MTRLNILPSQEFYITIDLDYRITAQSKHESPFTFDSGRVLYVANITVLTDKAL